MAEMPPALPSMITRTPPASGSDPLVPEPLAAAIIQELPRASAALAMMNRVTLSARTQRMPVLDVLPMAYWVGGTTPDVGLKETTRMAWQNVMLVVEECAAIVPIAEAYLDDADVPIWSEVQPRLTEAIGALIDRAVIWNSGKPASWSSPALITGITQSGQAIPEGTGVDFGQDVSVLGQLMALTGYTVNGFIGIPGVSWKLTGMRSEQGAPIYQPDMTSGPGGRLYGYAMNEIDNGSWGNGYQLIGGDFSKAIIGVRQDISFKVFTEGVVSDANGSVVLNLMQQDSIALRVTMRLAYATANPVTVMQPGRAGSGAGLRWPFGAISNGSATSDFLEKYGWKGVESDADEDHEEHATRSGRKS